MNSYITDTQLIEGSIAAVVWSIFWIYLRNYLQLSAPVEGGIAWMAVWVCRKFGLTIYKSLKAKHKWRDFNVIILPFPEIQYKN
tara:strand:+ start:462 stop:713 length:252 start_codon:yes stop_codon:yes gene_type:complete